jgi:flagellar basal-body rod protein FlgB
MLGIQSLGNDATAQSLKLTLEAAAARHEAIASNIANVNTPNYKRMDLSPTFQAAYQRAMDQLQDGKAMDQLPQASISEIKTGLERYDGNNVDFDKEMVAMMQNQTQHEFATKMLAQYYHELHSAISGNGG